MIKNLKEAYTFLSHIVGNCEKDVNTLLYYCIYRQDFAKKKKITCKRNVLNLYNYILSVTIGRKEENSNQPYFYIKLFMS